MKSAERTGSKADIVGESAPLLRRKPRLEHIVIESARNAIVVFSVIAIAMIGACSAPVAIDADSVREFSGSQGRNDWWYGYWDESADIDGDYNQSDDFRLMQNFGADPINRLSFRSEFTTGELWYLEDGRYYTSLWAEGGHPHARMEIGNYAQADQWVVRRWVSPADGRIDITGHAGKVMPWGENWDGSVRFRIMVRDRIVFDTEASDGGGSYSVSVDVAIGTPVDFLIGPGSAIGVSRFTARLSRSEY